MTARRRDLKAQPKARRPGGNGAPLGVQHTHTELLTDLVEVRPDVYLLASRHCARSRTLTFLHPLTVLGAPQGRTWH